MTSPTQIRIDSDVKNSATKLFKKLGLDMSSAVNLFLYQCVLWDGLPFTIELPKYNDETIESMVEANMLSKNKNIKGYNSIEELNKALDEEW